MIASVVRHKSPLATEAVSATQAEQARRLMEEHDSDEDTNVHLVLSRDIEEARAHYRTLWSSEKEDMVKPGASWATRPPLSLLHPSHS